MLKKQLNQETRKDQIEFSEDAWLDEFIKNASNGDYFDIEDWGNPTITRNYDQEALPGFEKGADKDLVKTVLKL